MTSKIYTLADIAIAAAATRQQVSTADTPIQAVIVQAASGNTGNIFVGDILVSATRGLSLAPGVSIRIDADAGDIGVELILSDLYVDTATNGNIAKVAYLKAR